MHCAAPGYSSAGKRSHAGVREIRPELTLALQQVKEGGRIMTWAALHPKFNESFESWSFFRLQRASERILVTTQTKAFCYLLKTQVPITFLSGH
jgi:hypothetical protein